MGLGAFLALLLGVGAFMGGMPGLGALLLAVGIVLAWLWVRKTKAQVIREASEQAPAAELHIRSAQRGDPPTLRPDQVPRLPPRPADWPVLPPLPSMGGPERPYVEVADRAYARTDCPHCGVQLDPLPKAKKRCPACGHEIFVKSGPDNRRYLLRADEREAIEAQWQRQREADWAAQHARAEAALDGWLHQAQAAGITVGDVALEAVGESFHLGELVALKQRYPDGLAVALLRREPTNPYDRDAVEVLIDGLQVGHLSRDDAADYQDLLVASERLGRGLYLVAELVGGDVGSDGLHGPVGVFFEHAPSPS